MGNKTNINFLLICPHLYLRFFLASRQKVVVKAAYAFKKKKKEKNRNQDEREAVFGPTMKYIDPMEKLASIFQAEF